MSQAAWRKWHRWVGFVAAPFLIFAAVTGIAAGVAEMTSEDEEARERARERVSEVKLPVPPGTATDPVARALTSATTYANGAPVDKVTVDFKADPQTVTVYLGKPGGGADTKLVYHAGTGDLLRKEPYEDKPFLTRLHSGEALGDWGLVFGTAWGVALVVVLGTGMVIYFAMRKPGQKGLSKLFW
ncbi:MAG TPA: PepSY-associated TM helix domain-containing protein [Gemmata sp.]